MKQIPIILLLLVLTLTVAAQAPAEKRRSFLDVLKVDQKVGLKEAFGRYEISFFEDVPDVQTYTIKAIEADHLVLEDFAEINETHIPLNSIKAVVRVKLLGK